MIKTFEGTPRFFMTYEYSFEGVRYIENRLQPVNWKLSINMSGPELEDKKEEEQSKKTSIMYQKILFWLDTVLNDCIVSSITSVNSIGAFHNTKVVLPDEEPTDDIFLQTLHSKLSVISGDDMIIGQLSLYSTDSNVTYHYNHGGSYGLPSQSNFIGDDALHDVPWWERNDCDTFDVNSDHESKDDILKSSRILSDFEKHLTREFSEDEEDFENPAEIITIEQWQKPRKV